MPITDLKTQILSDPNAVVDFIHGGGVPAVVQSAGNVFPMNLNGKTLVVKISTDGGSSYPTTRTHTFTHADPFTTIAMVVADILADATFMGGGTPDLLVQAVGLELMVKTKVAGSRALKVDAASSSIGVSLLQFLSGQIGNGSIMGITQIVCDASGKYVVFFT